jgi:RNA polymerase sigma-70 factor (ECF subfamily)
VRQALNELPECFRATVYLADVEGYPYRDVAELLGVPIGTVMSRLHRARGMLRKRLSAYA